MFNILLSLCPFPDLGLYRTIFLFGQLCSMSPNSGNTSADFANAATIQDVSRSRRRFGGRWVYPLPDEIVPQSVFAWSRVCDISRMGRARSARNQGGRA